MNCIETFYPQWRDADIHESSPGNRGASLKLRNNCNNYIASHFFAGEPLGNKVKGFRNEDLENQTFAAGSFDLVITQDVMEHVFDPAKAFSEIARTLRKGGAHIFTVPLVNKGKPSEKWAELNKNGEVVDFEIKLVRKSGKHISCSVNAHFLYDDNKKCYE